MAKPERKEGWLYDFDDKTIQNHGQGTSVPEIFKRYQLTGQLPDTGRVEQFFDVTKIPSLVESLNFGAKFTNYFASLPSAVRDYFHNDPQRLMVAIGDDKQKDKLIEFGVLTKAKVAPPVLGSKDNPIHTVVPGVQGVEGADAPPVPDVSKRKK